jgi:hypothetical protein
MNPGGRIHATVLKLISTLQELNSRKARSSCRFDSSTISIPILKGCALSSTRV